MFVYSRPVYSIPHYCPCSKRSVSSTNTRSQRSDSLLTPHPYHHHPSAQWRIIVQLESQLRHSLPLPPVSRQAAPCMKAALASAETTRFFPLTGNSLASWRQCSCLSLFLFFFFSFHLLPPTSILLREHPINLCLSHPEHRACKMAGRNDSPPRRMWTWQKLFHSLSSSGEAARHRFIEKLGVNSPSPHLIPSRVYTARCLFTNQTFSTNTRIPTKEDNDDWK